MDPFGISLGLGMASAASSWWLRQQQAERQRAETDEALRRTRLQHQVVVGEATARAAASGVEVGGSSMGRYLQAMTDEFGRQERWLELSGHRQADATSLSANLGAFGDLGGSLFGYAQNNNWWKTP